MTEVAETIFIVTTATTMGQEPRGGHGADGYIEIRSSTREQNGLANDPDRWISADPPSCFEDAVGIAALRLKLVPSDNTVIDAEFDLCLIDGARSLQARFTARLPGLPTRLARGLADIARQAIDASRDTRLD